MANSPEQDGFNRTLRKQGRTLKLLSPGKDSGKIFRATINRIGAFTLLGELGQDPRGKRVMEIMAAGAPQIIDQNIVQDVATKEKFRVVTIGLDCPAYSFKYEIQQGAPGKDNWA